MAAFVLDQVEIGPAGRARALDDPGRDGGDGGVERH
jgi:hypothetical protein